MPQNNEHTFRKTLKAIKDLQIQEVPIPEDILKIGRPVGEEAPVSIPVSVEEDQEVTTEQSDNIPVTKKKVDEQDDVSGELDDVP